MKVIITEKPSVGRDFARVLGVRSKRDGYIEGSNISITWAIGHLVELEEPEAYDNALKRWSLETLPIAPEKFSLRIKKGKGLSKQFRLIKKLISEADEVICATDAGREGELIFRYILQKAGKYPPSISRVWISSLTDSAIRKGYESRVPLSEFDLLAAAAQCRSEADWLIGLNATRAYTVQYAHGQGVLSIGRVQTPVLAMIVQRDQTIAQFVSEDFFQVKTEYKGTLFTHDAGRLQSTKEAQTVVEKIQAHPLSVSEIETKKEQRQAPLLFDLTELQKTLNRMAGFSASRTLAAAQKLYEQKRITYPRTDSKHLSWDLFPTCQQKMEKLSTQFQEAKEITFPLKKNGRYFNNAKVSDHHAIIPTGVMGTLQGDLATVYNIIAKRFIAIFYPPCIEEKQTVKAFVFDELFTAKGKRVLDKGWTSLYPPKKKDEKEHTLPPFLQGEAGPHSPFVHQGTTEPPKPYTEASLLSAMETAGKEVEDEELRAAMKAKGLGTPATRAATIETLLKREYIHKQKKILTATAKGKKLIQLLQNQPVLISPELTGQWEQKLSLIEKGDYSSSAFMKAVREFAAVIVSRIHESTATVGLGPCPYCGSPVIKGSKGGYGCSSWKEGCQFRFHGTQFGVALSEDHVSQLLAMGRLRRIRTLNNDEQELKGYLALNKKSGSFYIQTKEEKLQAEAIGRCPSCGGSVVEKYKSYNCSSCDLVIWKTITGKKVSIKLAQVLLSKGRSTKLKGFRSKAGKRFSATLVLENNKVTLKF